jgi:hypothetical protein
LEGEARGPFYEIESGLREQLAAAEQARRLAQRMLDKFVKFKKRFVEEDEDGEGEDDSEED